jgi:hypothetical protein
MDQLARDYADKAHFVFIYAREAHPGDFPQWPEHKTIEQKFEQAKIMKERHGTPRTIVIDDVEGAVHRKWNGMPNMSWIIDHTGRVFFKAGWTVASDLRAGLRISSSFERRCERAQPGVITRSTSPPHRGCVMAAVNPSDNRRKLLNLTASHPDISGLDPCYLAVT